MTILSHKYEAMMKLSEDFSFINGYELSTMTTEELNMRASNLDSKYPNDINQAEFVSEIKCFKFQADALLRAHVSKIWEI